MQLKLKNHKANIFEQLPFDNSKQSIVFLPGAGMDHRILSMFNLEELHNSLIFWVLIYLVMALLLVQLLIP